MTDTPKVVLYGPSGQPLVTQAPQAKQATKRESTVPNWDPSKSVAANVKGLVLWLHTDKDAKAIFDHDATIRLVQDVTAKCKRTCTYLDKQPKDDVRGSVTFLFDDDSVAKFRTGKIVSREQKEQASGVKDRRNLLGDRMEGHKVNTYVQNNW